MTTDDSTLQTFYSRRQQLFGRFDRLRQGVDEWFAANGHNPSMVELGLLAGLLADKQDVLQELADAERVMLDHLIERRREIKSD